MKLPTVFLIIFCFIQSLAYANSFERSVTIEPFSMLITIDHGDETVDLLSNMHELSLECFSNNIFDNDEQSTG